MRSVQNDSPLQRLARLVLAGRDPGEWVRDERDKDRAWQQIADDLSERTGLTVSRETVRLWATAGDKAKS